jgi:hypothetical protein
MASSCTFALQLPFKYELTSLQVATLAIGNSIQAYSTLKYTQEVYAGPEQDPNASKPQSATLMMKPSQSQPPVPVNQNPNAPYSPVTPLSSRTFGTWTFLSSVIRLYAAYHIDKKEIYELAFATYLIACGHFLSEWLVFKTARMNRALAFPVFVSIATIGWMTAQWNYYVK